MRSVRVLVMLALALGSVGCGQSDTEKQVLRVEAAFEEATAKLVLPDFTHRIEPVEVRTRLAVTLDGVHVDNSSLVGKLSHGDADFWEYNDPGELLVFAGDVVKLDRRSQPPGKGPLIPDLQRSLARAAKAERKMGQRRGSSWTGALNLYVDHRIPYSTVVRIIYTAGQAGYDNLYSVVRAGASDGSVVISRARMTPGPDHVLDRCAEPAVVIQEDALFLTVMDGGRRKDNRWIDLSPQALTASFERITGKDGFAALAAFEESLSRKMGNTPPCNIARIAAHDDIPWREVMATVGTLRRVAPFEWMNLTTAASHPMLDMSKIQENFGAAGHQATSTGQIVQE